MMRKTPLVLCPGLLCDAALWAPQIDALRETCEIFVPVLTGMDTVRALAAAVLDAAPWPQFALAGLSLGGYVALEAFAAAPRRVIRLALFGTRASPERARERERRAQLVALARRARGFAALTRRLFPRQVAPAHRASDGLRATVVGMAERIGVDAYVRQQRAIATRRDRRSLLRYIDVPTLVLCGRDDRVIPPAESAALAAAIPGARLVTVPHCGHLSPLEAPAAVTAALCDWLRNRGVPRELPAP